MPFSAEHCLRGFKCGVDQALKDESQYQESFTNSDQGSTSLERTEQTNFPRPVTFPGRNIADMMDFPDYDYYMLGPIPSELELHQKARSFGLLAPAIASSARNSRNAKDTYSSRLIKPDKMAIGQARVDNGVDSIPTAGMYLNPKPISLPKIPVIKHSFQGSIPTVMRADMTDSTHLPECITALSPRTKSSWVDISKLEKRLLPPSKPTSNSQTSPVTSTSKLGSKKDEHNRGIRIIVSPNSRAYMQARPKDYYGTRYPLVMLEGQKPKVGRSQDFPSTRRPTLNTTRSLPAISGWSSETLPNRTRGDAIAVEQVIEMSTSNLRPMNLNVAGWFQELRCRPKKLHTKSLEEGRRHVLGKTTTLAK